MCIVEEVLKRVKLGKRRNDFIKLLMSLWLAIPGRINYANLARFSDKNEKTFRNGFAKPLDFVAVNSYIVEVLQAERCLGQRFALAVDTSFVNKSGKATPELGKYWDSKQGKAARGLEVSCCALIDPEQKYALPLDAQQTPASLPEGETRLDHYAKHVVQVLANVPAPLREQITYVVGDAYYSKKPFVDKIVQAEKHVVGKLRCDANLRYLYQGKPTGKAGRPRKFAGKVDFKDFSGWQEVINTDTLRIYTQRLYHVGLGRTTQVVCVLHLTKDKKGNLKEKRNLFFSTDTQQQAQDILDLNQVRFQILKLRRL